MKLYKSVKETSIIFDTYNADIIDKEGIYKIRNFSVDIEKCLTKMSFHPVKIIEYEL